MKILKFGKFLKFDSELIHFVSTRKGDFDKAPFFSSNLALHVNDEDKAVLKNRQKLSEALKIPLGNFVFANQTHSDNTAIVKAENRGDGVLEQKNAIKSTDALITRGKNICMVVLVADCVPVILFDQKQKVIAVIHAGWQGTVKRIVEKTIKKMVTEFNCNPTNIIAGVGPSIGPCHFEVQSDVFIQFQEVFGRENDALIYRDESLFVDLWELNKKQLLNIGVLPENVEIMKKCTVCQNKEFFSARKEKITGRFGVGIMLK